VNLVDELHAISAALVDSGIRHAVCGGVAVTVYGATRSTKDIDILIAPDDLPRTLDAVRPLGYAYPALPLVFEEGTARERRVQRVSKIDGQEHLVLDLLLAVASFERFLEGSVKVDLPQGPLVVVSRDVLVRMKRQAGRPQDLADLEKLEGGGGGGESD
jgi:hypothetical protein